MKKKLIFIALLCLSIMACNDDASGEVNTTSSAQENAQKTSNSPLENFRLAINEMNQPKYFPTKESLLSMVANYQTKENKFCLNLENS